ncbi:50S ribosomal protein L3 [Patescibacteria group bacterium]|nr:50S ribosomal protein L3 [Patescibacteria group bacterium]
MSKLILAHKQNMERLFLPDGQAVAVTRLKAGPCWVTQIKEDDKDGYRAVQVGFAEKKKVSKPLQGHLKAVGKNLRHLQEFDIPTETNLEIGQVLDVNQFQLGDKVAITAKAKGLGFQGVVKRHGFKGHPSSHGHKDQSRMPGSIGAGGVQHVRKGMRMAGRMGGQKVTVHNLEIMGVDAANNELLVKGAVPGAFKGLVSIVAEK